MFVNITLAEIALLKQTDGVINMLYWMGEPAVIKEDEIEAIKEFTSDHQDIKLERTKVNVNGEARIVDGPSYTIMDGKMFMVNNRLFNVNLPSLGFTMTAEMKVERILGKEILFGNRELMLNS